MPLPAWQSMKEAAIKSVEDYHASFPLRKGMPREELKSRMRLAPRLHQALIRKLSAEGLLEQSGAYVLNPGHAIQFNEVQRARIAALMRRFAAAPYGPPSIKECQQDAGEEVIGALIEQGELVPVSAEVVFRRSDYEDMKSRVRSALVEKGRITLAEVRDLFGTTRKYAQALLEHLDASGVTTRDGDFRKLRS
jgi:selenocysteine-specific elongation factor